VLPGLLGRLGVRGDMSFLYSVFQDKSDSHTTMVFRGDATGTAAKSALPDGTELRLFSGAECPLNLMVTTSQAAVLKRYFRERGGTVRHLLGRRIARTLWQHSMARRDRGTVP
jgi:hypothetical protein